MSDRPSMVAEVPYDHGQTTPGCDFGFDLITTDDEGERYQWYGSPERRVGDDDGVLADHGFVRTGPWQQVRTVSGPAMQAPVRRATTGLADLGAAAEQARGDLYAAIVSAVAAGMSEAEAARQAGVDRMTVRRLLGKR